jgi:uncharacterized protein YgiM (DUF1202 family)
VTPEPAPSPAAEEKVIGSVRVKATALNVRKEPSTTADVLVQVKKGQELPLLAENESWSKVKLDSGEIGWVCSQHVARVGAKASGKSKKRGSCPPDSDFAFVKTPMPAFTEGGPHGLVVVDATVNTAGDVTATKVVSNTTGEPGMAMIVEKEIRSAKFEAPVRDCAKRTFIFTYKRSF